MFNFIFIAIASRDIPGYFQEYIAKSTSGCNLNLVIARRRSSSLGILLYTIFKFVRLFIISDPNLRINHVIFFPCQEVAK